MSIMFQSNSEMLLDLSTETAAVEAFYSISFAERYHELLR